MFTAVSPRPGNPGAVATAEARQQIRLDTLQDVLLLSDVYGHEGAIQRVADEVQRAERRHQAGAPVAPPDPADVARFALRAPPRPAAAGAPRRGPPP